MFVEASRKQSVVLKGEAYNETVRVKLPAGFEVDELPDSGKFDEGFGRYTASYEVKDGYLLFRRNLELQATTIPVDQYMKVRGFFERIRAAEQVPVVLAKVNRIQAGN